MHVAKRKEGSPSLTGCYPELGKVTLKSIGDEALSDEFL
jgi:hypothetical protein